MSLRKVIKNILFIVSFFSCVAAMDTKYSLPKFKHNYVCAFNPNNKVVEQARQLEQRRKFLTPGLFNVHSFMKPNIVKAKDLQTLDSNCTELLVQAFKGIKGNRSDEQLSTMLKRMPVDIAKHIGKLYLKNNFRCIQEQLLRQSFLLPVALGIVKIPEKQFAVVDIENIALAPNNKYCFLHVNLNQNELAKYAQCIKQKNYSTEYPEPHSHPSPYIVDMNGLVQLCIIKKNADKNQHIIRTVYLGNSFKFADNAIILRDPKKRTENIHDYLGFLQNTINRAGSTKRLVPLGLNVLYSDGTIRTYINPIVTAHLKEYSYEQCKFCEELSVEQEKDEKEYTKYRMRKALVKCVTSKDDFIDPMPTKSGSMSYFGLHKDVYASMTLKQQVAFDNFFVGVVSVAKIKDMPIGTTDLDERLAIKRRERHRTIRHERFEELIHNVATACCLLGGASRLLSWYFDK